MGALTSGSWTIAFRNDISQDMTRGKRKRQNALKITSVSGNPPTKWVLPGAQSAGMIRNLDRYYFDTYTLSSGQSGGTASGALFITYNATGNSITFYRSTPLISGTGRAVLPLVTTAVIKALTLYLVAEGW